MPSLLRRIRGALGMGLTWAVGWWCVGGLIELVHNIWPNPLGAAVDIWPAALALPALFGGVAFSVVLGIAGRRSRFDELSLPRFAAWGAAGGLLLSLAPAALVAAGLATGADNAPDLWRLTLSILGPVTVLSAASASATLAIARMADDRELLEAAEDVADVGLTQDEARELLRDS